MKRYAFIIALLLLMGAFGTFLYIRKHSPATTAAPAQTTDSNDAGCFALFSGEIICLDDDGNLTRKGFADDATEEVQ